MKTILEFDSDILGDNEAYENARLGLEYFLCLYNIYHYLRDQIKYVDPKDQDTTEQIYEKFFEITKERGVEI